MNDLPPKLNPAPVAPGYQKPPAPTSGSTAQHRFLLGLITGVVLGMILATLLWVPIGLLAFRRSSAGAPFEAQPARVETTEAGEVADNATMAEIDAASQLSFENSKLGLYTQIAARPSLSPAAQVHLVEIAVRQLSFENSRLQVLSKLIANPSFSSAGKEAILKNLGSLSFENSKQAILDAVNRQENPK